MSDNPFTAESTDCLGSITGRLFSNARAVRDRTPRHDLNPTEQARQRYYAAEERAAVARDIIQLAEFADWAALLPGLEQAAEDKRAEALRVYGEYMAAKTSDTTKTPARDVVDVELPFETEEANQ